MNNADLLSMGIKNLLRRKARTILTVLGVVVGTASIVIMLSLGIAMNVNFQNELENMGSLNTIEVSPKGDYEWDEESGESRPVTDKKYLNAKTVEEFALIPYVDGVLPMTSEYYLLQSGRYQANVQVYGVPMDQVEKFGFEVEEGTMPESRNDMLVGSSISNQFYDPNSRGGWNPIEIDIMNARIFMSTYQLSGDNSGYRGIPVKASGILKSTNGQEDWSVYVDMDDFDKIKREFARASQSGDNNGGPSGNNKNKNDYQTVKVRVDDINHVADVQKTIEGMGFYAWSLGDILDSMKKQSAALQAVLGGIGAVSLFVAAIGITNTMVMSIYERTKEIGVMKVLGADVKDIKKLFLFESAIIGLMGGLFGLMLSFMVSYLLNNFSTLDFLSTGWYGSGDVEQMMSVIPAWLVLLALAFSTLVGIVSGYYPAKRATQLSALEAIKTE